MMLRGLQQGDLARWLRVVADAQDAREAAAARAASGAEGPAVAPSVHAESSASEPVPDLFVEHLLLLRCIERGADGALRVTEKGRLALHMERPDAPLR